MPDTDSADDDKQQQFATTVQTKDSGALGSTDPDATAIDGARGSLPPPGSAAAMTTPLVSWKMPTPPSMGATDRAGGPIRLWRPADVGVISFLIGFPAGLGLAARNSWRVGRRRRAWAQLAGSSVGLLAVVLVPVSGNGVAAVLNIAMAIYVYYQTKSDFETAQRAGHPVERGGVASGFATALGAWALALAATFVVLVLLELAGGPANQPGNAALASSYPASATSTPGPIATGPTPHAAASVSV